MREQRGWELRGEIGQVWRLSLPAILTQITTIAMQYIDSAMVGTLGANASAAIGLVASTTWLFGGITYVYSHTDRSRYRRSAHRCSPGKCCSG